MRQKEKFDNSVSSFLMLRVGFRSWPLDVIYINSGLRLVNVLPKHQKSLRFQVTGRSAKVHGIIIQRDTINLHNAIIALFMVFGA